MQPVLVPYRKRAHATILYRGVVGFIGIGDKSGSLLLFILAGLNRHNLNGRVTYLRKETIDDRPV